MSLDPREPADRTDPADAPRLPQDGPDWQDRPDVLHPTDGQAPPDSTDSPGEVEARLGVPSPADEPAPEPAPVAAADAQTIKAPSTRSSGFRGLLELVGLVAPKRGHDPYAHRRGEPRGFAALWMFYLLIASAVVYSSVGTPSFGSETGFRYASKILMTVISAGVVLVWPMVRLSQRSPERPARSVLRDMGVLLVPVQAFYWPQLLLTQWGADAVGGAMLVLVAWLMVVGAVLVVAARTVPTESWAYADPAGGERVLVRVLWMLVILVLPLIGPWLWRSAGHGSADLLALASPLTAHWEMLRDRVWTGSRTGLTAEHWRMVLLSLIVGTAVWVLVLLGVRPVGPAPGRPPA
ncbi:MAG: hypothetical protein AAGH71_00250 [Planctomycetota bacterium]